jgi:hypothetical protein
VVGIAFALYLLEDTGKINLIHETRVYEAQVDGVNLRRPPDSSESHVQVVADTSGYCVNDGHKPEIEHVEAEESVNAVRVRVWVREFEEPNYCDGVGYGAPATVELASPLGPRAIVAEKKDGGEKTIWPSESEFDCLRRLDQPSLRRTQRPLRRDEDRDNLSVRALLAFRTLRQGAGTVCRPGLPNASS